VLKTQICITRPQCVNFVDLKWIVKMVTIYNTITCTHGSWEGVWWEGRSWVLVFHIHLHNPVIEHYTGTLEFVQKAVPDARRATEPREGPSPVTPKNALRTSYISYNLNYGYVCSILNWPSEIFFCSIILSGLMFCLKTFSHCSTSPTHSSSSKPLLSVWKTRIAAVDTEL